METNSNLDLSLLPPTNDHSSVVICPVCGLDCTHLKSVLTEQKDRGVLVTSTGTHEIDVNHSGRGSAVSINFFCESGHHFALRFQFHKGSVFAYCPIGEEFNPAEGTPDELWRD